MELNNFKYFIWDFDGCIADTEYYHFKAYREAFLNFGHEIHEEDYYPVFTHLGNGAQREIEKYHLTCTEQDIARIKNETYDKLLQQNPPKVFPEIPKILEKLQQIGKIAIASNSPRHEIELILKANGIESYFAEIIGKTPELRKKPEPDIFLLALQKLEADKAQSVIFEDAEKGLIAANKAGCACVWVKNKRNQQLKSQAQVDLEITHKGLAKLL